ncbi:taste receptor type 2 member 40-like [Hyperolius riggenbachi]|uniref:taste receptor type 2 member 40-like n=1 Tax=Hyperolius riggenbachi TaxID=752182 RepID=UPI0035A365EF
MLPVFLLFSMTVLSISTLMGSFTNSIIIAMNILDKVKGKALSSSDLILVAMAISNVIFQFIMLTNDFLNFLASNVYFIKEVNILFSVILNISIYVSFWFTACLSINYYFQIVIFTHPFAIRLKHALSRLTSQLLMATTIVSVAMCLPAIWTTYLSNQDFTITSNQTMVDMSPDLSFMYVIISCSVPLTLVAIANGLIIKSLISHTHKSDRNGNGDLSSRAEGRYRAARTISCLLFIYISFYTSEILMYAGLFSQDSPGTCICLIVIYSYSPAQSIVLIVGSPKLKQASLHIIRCIGWVAAEKSKKVTVSFIDVKIRETTQCSTG